jgi:hypothetical protein
VSDTNHSKLSEDDNSPKVPTNPQITHAENCWSWGPAHYACACAEVAKLRGWQSGQDQAK